MRRSRPIAASFIGRTVRDEAGSCGVLRAGAIAEIYELSDRAAFFGRIGPDTYAEWLRAIPPDASASLYLHVPFCRSMCWYCGCHTSIARRDEPIAVYASALRCEIDLVSRQIDRRIKVDHIHFGGGTPTIMAPETLHGPDRLDQARLLCASLGRNRRRDRSAHAHGADDRCARAWRRQPREPRRAELRPRRPACHQPGAEFRGDGRGGRQACGAPASPASISI